MMSYEEVAKRIGKRVKELRTQRGMTMGQVANIAQISESALYLCEHGRVDTKVYTIFLIAEAKGVRPGSILDAVTEEEAG